MKNHLFKRILSLLLVAALLAGYYVPGVQAASTGVSWKETDETVRPDMSGRKAETHVEEDYAPTDRVRVSIVLEDKPTVQAGFPTRNIGQNTQAMAYNRQLMAKQDAMAKTISAQALSGQKLDVQWNLTLVGNIISANVPYGRIDAIREVDGVQNVFLEMRYEPCVVDREENTVNPQMFSSLGMGGTRQVWSNGYTGAGSRIAVIDTGTDINHQSLDNGAFLHALQQNADAKGISYASYVKELDLLDELEIASVLADLKISQQIPGVTVSDLFLNEKLAFAANYVDGNLTVDHQHDEQGEHGSHVAGIATANRYIPENGGYAEALDTVLMAGMAPDAQLITMKVFGYYSPYESDYMAAIEDAILLNCDAVNLSLGSSSAGDAFSNYYSDLLDYMTTTDTVVVASAGNSYSWPMASLFGYLYNDDVNLDMVGSPGSYPSFFTVASVENDGGIGAAFKAAGRTMFYGEVTGYGNTALASLDKSANATGTEYEYVFVDGLGYPEDYSGMDLSGKIVFCSRGTLNFAVKANNAMELGAEAVIIYNNDSSGVFGMDLTGLYYARPCVSLSMEDADLLRSASTERTTSGGLTYYTGKMTVLGKQTGVNYGSEYYTMSDFSSWGVPGDLSLKPEITAPGGMIYSLWGTNTVTGGGTDKYETMSGTSMAAPAITGMTALVAQYLRETGLAEQEGMKARTLAQSLLMSTATPLREQDSGGQYYSLMNQGAGLGRVDLATAADSYILVEGQPDGKVKAELGDDPSRTGVYEFSFSINNLSGEQESYALSADVFCQDQFEYQEGSDVFLLDTWTTDLPAIATFTVNGKEVSAGEDLSDYDLNGDGTTNASDADYLLEYLLGNETAIHGQKDVNQDGRVSTYDAHVLLAMLGSGGGLVTVPAGGSVTVDVKLTLTAEGKAMLNSGYPNGTYVEAYVYAESVSDEEGVAGTVHSIPVLAFYGNWSDATMFDRGTAVELYYLAVNTAPYLYRYIGIDGNCLTIDYGDGEEYYFGGNPYVDDDYYLPERNAFNSEDISKLAAQYFTLIRNASDMQLLVSNADTGEIYFQKGLGMGYSAYYIPSYGQWDNTQQMGRLNWTGKDAAGKPLPEGTNVEVTLVAVPEYYRNADGTHNYEALGEGAYMTTRFTIDNTAPVVKSMEQVDNILTVTAQDNEYVAAAVLMNSAGTTAYAAETPNQTVKNTQVTLELDLTGAMGKNFLLAVYDYAGNEKTYEISLDVPEIQREYFTAIDYNSMDYVGVNKDGQVTHIVSTGLPLLARAAEYVGGYVFIVTEDNSLCVANDEDLSSTIRIGPMDPYREFLITGFNDIAYNYADGKLYGQFYSEFNYEAAPYLCTIDMTDGSLELVCELPVDVNTMAIDTQGNFYSAGYADNKLYTYTLADVTSAEPSMTLVGEMGYYYSSYLTNMAWDHNEGRLYWAFPNTLVEIDPKTAEPTLKGYHQEMLVGLYTRPEQDEGLFDPVNLVDRVELNHTETRAMLGSPLTLEATVWPWNATDRSVTWSSSNTAVATVNENGVVTGISEGTTIITATSNLDPAKKATCTITVESLPEKTLNALVWDENGEIWMSEINTGDLPNYTKISDTGLGYDLASATVGQDGIIYAASLDASSLTSSLYKLDPETFQPTLIGPSTDGYVDLAPAPGMPGNSLAAAFSGNVLIVDATSGDYYTWYNMFSYNLVAIAYVGSQPYTDWGYNTTVDWYFIIDRVGYVYLLGFLEQDGSYFYLEHDGLAPGGIYTELGFEMDTGYFGSAYFDGEFLYFSAYKESWDNVTLMAIDVAGGSRECYTLGTFDDGVWPVAGLMELDLTELPDYMSVGVTAQPKEAEKTELVPLEASGGKTKISGGLNAASGNVTVFPRSAGEFEQENEQVVVTLTGADQLTGSTNGRMTVTYNADELKLVSVTGTTEAFAYTMGDGTVEVAHASAAVLPIDAPVATLTFQVLKPGEHEIVVTHLEDGDEPCGKEEYIYVTSGCDHNYEAVITEPTCQESGFTTYTCSKCGDSYVSDYTDPVDHVYEDGACKWCGEAEKVYSITWKEAYSSLGGNIAVVFKVDLSQDLAEDPNAFMRFTYAGKTVDVPVSEASRAGDYYNFFCRITSVNMTDDITAQMMVGEEAIGRSVTTSLEKYCSYIISTSTDTKTVNLMKAMLNYGAAAQKMMNYKTDNLANKSLSDADKVLTAVDATQYKHSITGTEDGIKPVEALLVLGSETTIRVGFQLTGDKSIEEYTFTVDGVEVEPVLKGGKYVLEVPNIAAHRLDEYHTFTCGGITVTYCGLSYVNQVMGYYTEGTTFDMAAALYNYSQATEAYTEAFIA